MDKLISADSLWMTIIHAMDYCEDILEFIEEEPEAVVRCKDCKWGTPHPEGDEYTKCFKLCTTFFSGHFCAWGERREDAETD